MIINDHYDQAQIDNIFGKMTKIIDAKTAIAILDNAKDSPYYKENINKINNTLNVHTKYPELYHYQHTNAEETVISAMDKMLQDK